MKNLDEIIDKYEAMGPSEIEKKLIENFELCLKLLEKAKLKANSIGVSLNIDTEGLMKTTLEAALGCDSRIDSKEYTLYVAICDKFGLEPLPLDNLRNIAREGHSEMGELVGNVYKLLPKFKQLIDTDIEVPFLEVLVGGISCNGQIDSAEYRTLLDIVSAGVTSTESNEETINELSVNPASPLIVAEMGATSTAQNDGSFYFSIGATIKNPNECYLAHDAIIKTIIMDANGNVLKTDSETIQYIDPASTFYFGGEFYISKGNPSKFKVLVEADGFVDVNKGQTFMDGVSFSSYNISKDRWNNLSFTGNINNNYKKRINWLKVYAVFRDSNKKISGGTNFNVQDLFPSAVDGFNTSINSTANIESVQTSVDFEIRDLM